MTATASPVLGRPLWYELMTTDMKAAEKFYNAVVGWTTKPFDGSPMPYTLLHRSAEIPVGGVMNRPEGMNAPPFWAMYVGVPKLEEGVAKVKSLGGSELSPLIDIPNVGRMQMVKDPQGAAFYLFQPASEQQLPEGTPEIGDASWHELMTTDAASAMKFYSDLFGWQSTETMDMGPMGKYYMFGRNQGSIGGMMTITPDMPKMPPNWGIYFRVPGINEAVEKIKANGGQITNGPMEVPGGDMIVNGMDPQGAHFALHARKA